jgi:hypothetical protein
VGSCQARPFEAAGGGLHQFFLHHQFCEVMWKARRFPASTLKFRARQPPQYGVENRKPRRDSTRSSELPGSRGSSELPSMVPNSKRQKRQALLHGRVTRRNAGGDWQFAPQSPLH